jgi:hypothetical protein
VRGLHVNSHDTARPKLCSSLSEDAQLALFEVLALLEEEDALTASLT